MDASKLLERAMQASERGNYDYAIELFQQLLTVQPDHVKARTELRAVERRKVQENGGMNVPLRVVAAAKGFVPLVKAGVYTLTKAFERRMSECEKYLQNDPECRLVLSLLARSAEESNYVDTAVAVYEDVKDLYPNDLSCIRRLARLYQKRGNIDSASECFQRILNARPRDEESERAVKDLAALKTMKEGQWDTAGEKGGYRDRLKDAKKAEDLEQSQHIMRTDEDIQARIDKVKADVEVDPRNTKILLQLADLYTRAGSREHARSVYKQVKRIDPRNLVVDRKLADLDIVDKQETVDGLKEKRDQNPNDEALKRQLDKEMAELREFQLKQLQSLVAAAPTDLTLKYKLGHALAGADDIDGAIAQFQLSSRDPKVRRDSYRMLGICFMRKEMFDMAAEFFNHALEDSSGVTSEAKDVIYHLGVCYEAQNLLDKAEESFKRILKVDIGFRDISKRIEEIQKKRKAETSS
jgi:tetratricopeptide (TPR) repeat protein